MTNSIIDAATPLTIFILGVSIVDVNNGLQSISFIVSITYAVMRSFYLLKAKNKNKNEDQEHF